jgi:hypothetical protein
MCQVGPGPCLRRGIAHTLGPPDIKWSTAATNPRSPRIPLAMRRAIAILVLVLALSVGGSNAAAQGENRWPTVFEQSFLASCKAASGGLVAVCRCELRWLEKRYTYGQLNNIYLRDKRQVRRIFTRAALACMH